MCQRDENAISSGVGAAVAGTLGSRGKWQVGAATGLVGAAVGYFAGPELLLALQGLSVVPCHVAGFR